LLVYWSETWSLTLREEHRLRLFERRMLRKIFGFLKRLNGRVGNGFTQLRTGTSGRLMNIVNNIWVL
jgi:hypothetical protein